LDISESRCKCPICKQWDKAKNMLPATLKNARFIDSETKKLKQGSWMGKAHLECIKKYNQTHQEKYSIREYDENGKFLGKVTPIK
jgi:hypothetical protein